MDTNRELTYGEKAVGKTFNPSNIVEVDIVKGDAANTIDILHEIRENFNTSAEQKRLCSIAITELQTAQMWAVKAITWKD